MRNIRGIFERRGDMKPLIKINSLHLHIRIIYFFSLLVIVVLGLPSFAVPVNTPFLSVDIDGDSGDTAAGWYGWTLTDAVSSGVSEVNTFGSVTVTLTPIGYDTGNGGADTVDRGSLPEEPLQDWVYAERNTGIGLGQHLIILEFSGLNPNTSYEVTLLGYDQNYGDDDGFMAFDTRDPSTYTYDNGWDNYAPAVGGINDNYEPGVNGSTNPYYGDLLARFPITGQWPSNYPDGIYYYSDSAFVTSDGSGVITIYAWNDSESWATQLLSLLGGFELGLDCGVKGNFTHDCEVNFQDFAYLSNAWLTEPNDIQWNPKCDISEPPDDIINTADLLIFAQNWLLEN